MFISDNKRENKIGHKMFLSSTVLINFKMCFQQVQRNVTKDVSNLFYFFSHNYKKTENLLKNEGAYEWMRKSEPSSQLPKKYFCTDYLNSFRWSN